MYPHEHHIPKKPFITFVVFVVLNLFAIDVFIILSAKNSYKPPQAVSTKIVSQSPAFPQNPQILQVPQAVLNQLANLEKTVQEATKSSISANTKVTVVPSAKEYFLPIGSGTNQTDDWEDLTGLQIQIDTTKYSTIKSAVFEASVRIPSKNEWAYVRLFNITDKHPVWFSEVYFPGGSDPKLLVSSPITLDAGVKTYQVQMKTQLKFPSYLDQSRIHITTY